MRLLKKSLSVCMALLIACSMLSILSVTKVFAASYNIAIGETAVTSDNYRNIFGDGTASYDPSTKTLTLNNPISHIKSTYHGDSTFGVIHFNTRDTYKLKGSFHMTSSKSEYGLYAPGSVILDGNFTFYGTKFGVGIGEKLTVNSGTLKGVATGNYDENDDNSASIGIYTTGTKAGEAPSELVINSGVTKIEASGLEAAIQTDKLTADGFRATSPVGANYIPDPVKCFALEDLSDKAKRLVLEPFSGTEYNVWVGARRVTSENKDDILGDGGKAQYNSSTKTLTLNDPEIKNYYEEFGQSFTYQIYSEDNLTLKGSYHMASPDPVPTIGAYGKKSLTLDGSFNFKANSNALWSDGNITINSGTLYAETDTGAAIYTPESTLTVKTGVTRVEAKAPSSSYALCAQTITIESNEEITTPSNGAVGSIPNNRQVIVNTDTGKYAYHAVIESSTTEQYQLFLSNTQVTSRNCMDVFNDGGSARYDHATKTLTLNNPTINGSTISGGTAFKILTSYDLTVKGTYHMSSADADVAIYSTAGLTLDGDFTFRGKPSESEQARI